MRRSLARSILASPLLALLFAGACGGGSGNFDPQNSAYGPASPATKVTSRVVIASEDTPMLTQVLGDKTVGGKTYKRIASTTPTDTTDGIEIWGSKSDDGATVTLAGIDGHSKLATKLLPPLVATLDTPVTVPLHPAVGQTQSVSGSATLAISNNPTPAHVAASGSYQLAETNVAVQTKVGLLHGCDHYSGTMSVTGDLLPGLLNGMPITGDVYYHPSFGVVALKAPAVGLTSTMSDSSDCGAPDGDGYVVTRKMGIVDANHRFSLDTYDCTGQFDADKDHHAKMLLELRFAEDGKARSSASPEAALGYRIEFGTIFGIYPYMLTQSPVSVLHPEENGNNFVYWIAYVDQAAKNETSQGIAYHISVSQGASSSPVKASARIFYHRL